MSNKKRIVIIGATSAMATHCVRIWLEKAPTSLVLVARDKSRLDDIAADLKIRSPQSEIQLIETDFTSPPDIASTIAKIAQERPIDIALIAHGSLPDQEECQRNLIYAREALEINGISPVLFAEAIASAMERANSGTLAIIGSVAGDRGRKSNYMYGAAKSLVARCVQGMQHRFAGTGVKVVLIKPGPTDTPMTAHLKATGMKLSNVALSANEIVHAIERGLPVAYIPEKWRYIMMIIRHLPGAVFNRLNI